MMSSMPRLRFAFNFTRMSPVLASVTAASPSCRPVRRDVLSTSGTSRSICFHMTDHAIGFCQRTARRHDVVEDKSAFVHLGQQVGPENVVTQIRSNDQHSAEDDQQSRTFQSATQPAFVKVRPRCRKKPLEMLLLRPASSFMASSFSSRKSDGADAISDSPDRASLLSSPSLDEVLAQSRGPRQRQRQRGQQ